MEGFLIFVLCVIGILVLVGVIAAGIAALPIVLILAALYLLFTHPLIAVGLLLVCLLGAIVKGA